MAQWAGDYFTPEQLAGVLASTSISFDLSVFELFVPLSTGGTVILAENALQLPLLAARSEVTLVNTVPSAMAELVRSGSIPSNVGIVSLAGEALPRELVRQLYQVESVEQVINLYGPSEDTTYSTFAGIAHDDEMAPAIGRPLPGTQAYVLDKAGQPVPVGVAGELFLGGEGLSRGYLNRPELTAERFVPDPFSKTPGARLYRTGDLVRFRADGVLEYLGRMDHQVKLRGFRIELGEIEAVLRRHEKVTEAIVLVSDCEGEKRLLAFVVCDEEPAALRVWLRERLPEYMVPSSFIALDELPLTPNGKVDRRALHALDMSQFRGDKEIIEPRTETEIVVAEMWRELLRVDHVSLDDNFFEAGGHSLLATRLMSHVTKRFDVEVTLRNFFEDPTIAGLANQIDLVSESAPALKAPPIKRRHTIANAPLSFAQQRLWFLSQLEADNTAYNMPAAFRLNGVLDIEALEESLSHIIERHEILRTIFVTEDGEPVQVVLPAQSVCIPWIDLSTLAESKREAEALRLATAEAQKPFNLSAGPLIRFTLLRLDDEEHLLLFTVHHIIFDGWSIGVLVKELTAFYGNERAATAGRPYSSIHGAELAVQYADFATWQREWLQGEVMDQQLAYWRKQLEDAPEALNLPTDRPRPAVLSTNGASQSFELPADLVASLKTLANEERATLFMVLLATFQVLLSRYSGQTDVMVGTAVANRNRAEIEGLIGFFVNMLVMRGDLSGDPTFEEYLARIRETALAAYAHQDLPFETIVESLQVGRSLNGTPLFQTTFVLQNEPAAELELAGLKLTRLPIDAGRAQFDLSLSMSETIVGKLTGTLTYNTDLFYHATIERMQEHFRTLLHAVAEQPKTRVSALPLLSPSETKQILFDWNDTAVQYQQYDLCLHELFEAQAAQTPDAVALISGGEQVSYKDLNERANQLAHYLNGLGVGPDVLVPVMLERSPEMIVALLGILKAGGAYVPIDPAYPLERLRFMLEDVNAEVWVSERSLAHKLPQHDATVILVDSDQDSIQKQSRENPASNVNTDNLVYVIYTSGTTGRPKGAMLAHREVVNCLLWMQETYALTHDDRMLCKTTLNFDPSVWEIFWPLMIGGKVVLSRTGEQQDVAALLKTIISQKVTIAYFVPSLLSLFLAEADVEKATSLRQVICGGESLPNDQVKLFYERLPYATLHHSYGPTETAIASSEIVCERDSEHEVTPIGRALANTQLYVLDQQRQPVPTGVPGELYIGGLGLGRGYLNRPELTAERFVPDCFSGVSGARLYRTGDLVRFTDGGVVEFLGRVDHQVKLRGFRIELAEIENVLRQHERVRDALVLVREEEGDKRLVAYVVGEVADLRAWLRERLPDYMVPQAFVMLDQMPVTTNGKVDRRALLALETEFVRDQEIIEPQTETEIAVADIWRDILRVDQVSLDDNFFEVGGHSLLATRLMSQVTKRFGIEVSLRRFFEAPTVEALANEIDIALTAETKLTAPSIGRAARDRYRMNITPHGPVTLPEAMRKEAI
jgi:amino acid adenylation domain-containing protein